MQKRFGSIFFIDQKIVDFLSPPFPTIKKICKSLSKETYTGTVLKILA